jgi:hypothetical protein
MLVLLLHDTRKSQHARLVFRGHTAAEAPALSWCPTTRSLLDPAGRNRTSGNPLEAGGSKSGSRRRRLDDAIATEIQSMFLGME